MTLPGSQWQPILNDKGEQIGWDTGDDEIRFSTPEIFLRNEGMMQLALKIKESKSRSILEQQEGSKKQDKSKKGKVLPKQRRGRA